MLRELHVTNLGIVDDLTLLLGSGLTAITGETGAGKTLLVEAVDLLLGGRSDAGLVRTGADEARIEGRFEDEAGGEILLVRVIPAEGRSRAYIDGALATVAQLAEVGATLVDLHGQHAHQALLQGRAQRKSLDRFIGTKAQESLDRLRSARSERNQLDKDLSALGGDERERAREIDLLSFQLDEIERAAIEHAGEDVALEAEEALLSDATNFREALAKAYDAVQSRCRDALGEAVGALNGREPFSGIEQRLRSVEAELGDVADEIRGTLERVVDDPERIEAVRSRRRLLR
ncbi:MAG: AAA family ATPase, partial [Actinobacteria bacterium]|nr:AAA family ATPase [Actinomycetota bacterium]